MTDFNETDTVNVAIKPLQLTGYHVAAMFIAFFGVIIAVNLTMAWFASSSWTGLVVKNSYVASQHYNEKIEAARSQKAMGWRTEFGYSNNLLKLSITDRNNQPIIFDRLTVAIGTPVAENKDSKLVLERDNLGFYQTKIELAEGLWAYQLVAEGEKPYQFEGRFFVDSKGFGIAR